MTDIETTIVAVSVDLTHENVTVVKEVGMALHHETGKAETGAEITATQEDRHLGLEDDPLHLLNEEGTAYIITLSPPITQLLFYVLFFSMCVQISTGSR